MLLTEYLSGLVKSIDEYSKSGYVLTSELKIDARTEKIGLIKGTIIFINNSKLFFTEYLDLTYRIEKLTYSFHYQDKNSNLIFRYDNAVHKPPLSFEYHKHIRNHIIQSEIPELRDVLEEIISNLLKTFKKF